MMVDVVRLQQYCIVLYCIICQRNREEEFLVDPIHNNTALLLLRCVVQAYGIISLSLSISLCWKPMILALRT